MNKEVIVMNLSDISADTKEVVKYMSNEYNDKSYKEIVLTLLDILDSVEYIEKELLKED